MKNIEVSIITVGMNHLHYLKSFLDSLYNLNLPKVSFETIYVDNCSTDGSVDFIKKNYPSVKIIENKNVLGFGENNNKGAEVAVGKYIAIMNPDLVFLKDSIDNLYNYSETLGFDSVVAPKLLNPDGTIQNSVRGFITPWVFVARLMTGGNDNTKNKIVQNYLCENMDVDKPQFIDWSIGAALFFKAHLYKKLNGFDPAYFLYMEDVDVCLRVWKLNSAVVYYPKSEIIHNHLRASRKVGKKMFMHFKSLLLFFSKNGIFIKSKKNNSAYSLP
ncbi:glycosyltransferase family 2 protein [Epilithonimonas sp.]|uniref:glycosyltransferase family 2 protein n=1 Tax=Epilithonimonas sp. TaxID=2894511 RepID=UPI00289A68F1|nr:glycosyltransferase family 2 protein [Epilithonimonas sp.]